MRVGHNFPVLQLAAAALLFTGCATNRANWDSRVGIYTYDQAVAQLGKPDQTTKLPDGQTAAEWISRYRVASPTDTDSKFYNTPASFQSRPSGSDYSESTLRLTFGTNDVLTGWSKN